MVAAVRVQETCELNRRLHTQGRELVDGKIGHQMVVFCYMHHFIFSFPKLLLQYHYHHNLTVSEHWPRTRLAWRMYILVCCDFRSCVYLDLPLDLYCTLMSISPSQSMS